MVAGGASIFIALTRSWCRLFWRASLQRPETSCSILHRGACRNVPGSCGSGGLICISHILISLTFRCGDRLLTDVPHRCKVPDTGDVARRDLATVRKYLPYPRHDNRLA